MLKIIVIACLLGSVMAAPARAAINPSWPYCENNSGHGDIREDAGRNQYSVCLFPDGSECDAFDFYYGRCNPNTGELVWSGDGLPDFDYYPAKIDRYTPPAKSLQLDDGLANLFNLYEFTGTLKKGLQKEPNFAGNHYLTSFGHCGTGCQNFVFIDRLSGKVSMPEVLLFNGNKTFCRESRLLILDGMLNEDETQIGRHYFVWSGGTLLPLKVSE